MVCMTAFFVAVSRSADRLIQVLCSTGMEGYKRPRQSPWETLPEHILLMAFKHLHIRQRRNVRLTCKAWAAVPVFTPRRLSRSKDMTIAQTEYLATLPTLQQLTLCQPRCIYAVSLLTQLTAIKLESYLTANLRPLKHLPRLSDLAIQGCAEIYDDDHEDICKLGDLLQLTQLRSLALGECKLRSLDAIAQLTWLTALSVAGLVGTDYEDDDPSLNDIGRLTQLRRWVAGPAFWLLHSLPSCPVAGHAMLLIHGRHS